MMKIRSIRPEFFADPTMADLDPLARLLYIGLWCYVDDDGRGEWLPKQIDGQIFPLEDVDIHALLEQLVRSERIIRYTDGDREYFYIPTIPSHQKPNRRYDSKLPDPAECTVSTGETGDAARTQRVDVADADAVEGEGEGEVGGEVVIAPDGAASLNELKAALVDILGEPPPQNWSLYNRIATWIRDQGGTPDEIRRKSSLIVEEWGRKALTATSLEKHWTRYDAEVGRISETDVNNHRREQERQQRRAEITGGDR